MKNKTFLHQTTADQFFDEDQFESYRKLGVHIARVALSDKKAIRKFNFKHKPGSEEEDPETTEKPFQSFFKTFRNFFTKNYSGFP